MAPIWWHTIGYILAGVGVLALLWALVWDRSRGRLRCPKCWYAMEDVASDGGSATCPECGKVAKSERKLKKTRRRWRWVAVPVVLWVLGYAVWVTPRVRDEGWVGAVPTTVMVLAATSLPDSWPTRSPNQSSSAGLLVHVSGDLERRCNDDHLWSWQWRLLLWTIRQSDPDKILFPLEQRNRLHGSYCGRLVWDAQYHGALSDSDFDIFDARSLLAFEIPERWPKGQPLYTSIQARHWAREGGAWTTKDARSNRTCEGHWESPTVLSNPGFVDWTDDMYEVAMPDQATGEYRLDVSMRSRAVVRNGDDWEAVQRLVREYQHAGHVRLEGTISDYEKPIVSEALSDFLSTHVKAYAPGWRGNALPVEIGCMSRATPNELRSFLDAYEAAGYPTIGGRLEALDERENIIASGFWWWSGDDSDRRWFESEGVLIPFQRSTFDIMLRPAEHVVFSPHEHRPLPTHVRLVPDPAITLRDRSRGVFLDTSLLFPVIDRKYRYKAAREELQLDP